MSQSPPSSAISDKVFHTFHRIILDAAGIDLGDSKRIMMQTRLTRRLRALELDTFEEYATLLEQTDHPERVEFIDALTTNLTYFFREPQHFAVLRHHVMPRLADKLGSHEPLRIWSAGCSSGQEAYSIAITLAELSPAIKRPVRILCTDIHSKMVEQTRSGIYAAREQRGLWREQQQRWFDPLGPTRMQAKPCLRNMLICKQSNLFSPWPIKPGVSVVFCRNTLIYFSPSKQTELIRRMAELQNPGAFLFLGHSENIHGCEDIYRRVANTVFERV